MLLLLLLLLLGNCFKELFVVGLVRMVKWINRYCVACDTVKVSLNSSNHRESKHQRNEIF